MPGRWLVFNVVGVLGFAVQMSVLALLVHVLHAPIELAVVVAVLAAVSHNFLWHERVTWDGLPRAGRGRRWLAFHASNGVVSLITNVIGTSAIATVTGWPVLTSNAVAVVLASVANFLLSDRLVFR